MTEALHRLRLTNEKGRRLDGATKDVAWLLGDSAFCGMSTKYTPTALRGLLEEGE
jgi:hypothetical protein